VPDTLQPKKARESRAFFICGLFPLPYGARGPAAFDSGQTLERN